jgi:hypothetical protein
VVVLAVVVPAVVVPAVVVVVVRGGPAGALQECREHEEGGEDAEEEQLPRPHLNQRGAGLFDRSKLSIKTSKLSQAIHSHLEIFLEET